MKLALFALVCSLFASQFVSADELPVLDNKKVMEAIASAFPLIRGPVDVEGWRPMGTLSITGQKITDGYCAPLAFQDPNSTDLFVGIYGQGAPISSMVIKEDSPVLVGTINGHGADTEMNIHVKDPVFPVDTLWIRIYQRPLKRVLEMMTIYANGAQATIECTFKK